MDWKILGKAIWSEAKSLLIACYVLGILMAFTAALMGVLYGLYLAIVFVGGLIGISALTIEKGITLLLCVAFACWFLFIMIIEPISTKYRRMKERKDFYEG